MEVITNTRLRDRKNAEGLTDAVIANMIACIPVYNSKSSTVKILSIEKDDNFDNPNSDMYCNVHICFDYKGSKKPTGKTLGRFTKMVGSGLHFEHTFDRAAYARKYSYQRYRTDDEYRKAQIARSRNQCRSPVSRLMFRWWAYKHYHKDDIIPPTLTAYAATYLTEAEQNLLREAGKL